jgi:hypothetical protein
MGGGLNGEGAGVTVCVRQWKSSLLIEVYIQYLLCGSAILIPTHIDSDLTFYILRPWVSNGGQGMLTINQSYSKEAPCHSPRWVFWKGVG